MNLRFIKRFQPEVGQGRISFWCEPNVRYDFEISWDEKKEDIDIFEEEFIRNCKNQLE